MVQCLSAFMDLCYLFRRNAITNSDLKRIKSKLKRFQQLRSIFIEAGVRETISLPRHHALVHYFTSITLFGSPNGLCSSITESKHIKAVKEPWRRSNHYKALSQMVCTINRLDKLAALHQIYLQRGMLVGTTAAYVAQALSGTLLEPSGEEDHNSDGEDDSDENGLDDITPSFGPKALTSVTLPSRPGTCSN
jgi:hypothetical protein